MNWHLEKTSSTVMQAVFSIQEKIEDTKGVIRSRKSKKERQCNDQASKWVSEWLLLDTKSASFQLYQGENKLIFNEMMMRSALY
jgi:hypothetical protein